MKVSPLERLSKGDHDDVDDALNRYLGTSPRKTASRTAHRWLREYIKQHGSQMLNPNPNRKRWVLRDPKGKLWKIKNLRQWLKANEFRFTDADSTAERPFWKRIASAFSRMGQGLQKTCYGGWIVVSSDWMKQKV
jgi:hypothetical protein